MGSGPKRKYLRIREDPGYVPGMNKPDYFMAEM
jgi:hypothetical protein